MPVYFKAALEGRGFKPKFFDESMVAKTDISISLQPVLDLSAHTPHWGDIDRLRIDYDCDQA